MASLLNHKRGFSECFFFCGNLCWYLNFFFRFYLRNAFCFETGGKFSLKIEFLFSKQTEKKAIFEAFARIQIDAVMFIII